MHSTDWIRDLFGGKTHGPWRPGRPQRRRGWQAERLEDRTLLANFHVLTVGDATLGSCSGSGCTLRDAVNAANANPGPDEITFAGNFFDSDPTDESYSITLASELVVTESLTINGFGGAALSISGNDATRLFRFREGGVGANAYTLNNLTLAEGNGIGGGGNGFGGVIQMNFQSDDTLNINGSVIRDSNATASGGAIHIQGGGSLNVRDSAIVNNQSAGAGGGLGIVNAVVSLTNVTVSGNVSVQSGGISLFASGPGATSELTIRNSTIASNSRTSSASGASNLLNIETADSNGVTVTYENTIFASPQGGGINVSNHVPSGNSSVVSLGNNISDDASGNLTQASDKPNTDAVLAPLSYNNSNLPTHAPLPGSPAIDGGADLSGDGITTDQRSVTRPQGSAFDIGAHEVQFDFGGDGVPGNVDGDADFDANDSFLIHLVKLSGTDTQIDESKGSSPVSAAEIRAAISQLHTVGDVDGDQDFDANDSFLIHLVKLSGTDAQIDQSRGSSALSATQIRANVDDLGGGRAVTQDAASPRMMQAVFAVTAERELFRAADQVLTALPVSTESPELQSAVFLDDFRKWIDAI